MFQPDQIVKYPRQIADSCPPLDEPDVAHANRVPRRGREALTAYNAEMHREVDETIELRQCWRTPPTVFDRLHDIFRFTIDACADDNNALLRRYWTKEQDCRRQDWRRERVFCNPPFSDMASISPKFAEARLLVVLAPANCLVTAYFRKHPARWIAIPRKRINFIEPIGLDVRKRNPSFGTVILLYGSINPRQLVRLQQSLSCLLFNQSDPMLNHVAA